MIDIGETGRKRIFSDAYVKASKDVEHTRRIGEMIQLGQRIMELLGNENHLLKEYETACHLAENIFLEHTYLIGSEDGFKMAIDFS